jgi:hypothetical protein
MDIKIVIARDEAIANYTKQTCMMCDCHAIARNDKKK